MRPLKLTLQDHKLVHIVLLSARDTQVYINNKAHSINNSLLQKTRPKKSEVEKEHKDLTFKLYRFKRRPPLLFTKVPKHQSQNDLPHKEWTREGETSLSLVSWISIKSKDTT